MDLVGLNNEKNQDNIQVYPSPANQSITINKMNLTGNIISYQFINAIGQVVLEHTSSTKNEDLIDVGNLTNGVYQLKLIHENGNSLNKKIMIQH